MLGYVPNDEADAVVSAVKLTGSRKSFQSLMDMMSGIDGYDPSNSYRQGKIGKAIGRELSRQLSSDEMEELVSVFWVGVLENIDKAAVTGHEVTVGRQSSSQTRSTMMNGVYFLKMHGLYAVRNYLNSRSRKVLMYVCDFCNTNVPVTRLALSCPYCNSTDVCVATSKTSGKHRKCNACGCNFRRGHTRACTLCGSKSISSVFRFDSAVIDTVPDGQPGPDDLVDLRGEEIEYEQIVDAISRAMPKDPSDSSRKTHTLKILEILTIPSVGKEVCDFCRESTPDEYCGATSFEFGNCNYSKKLGKFIGCTPALSNRRVDKVREVAIKCIKSLSSYNSVARNVLLRLSRSGSI